MIVGVLKRAFKETEKSENDRFKIGSVVFKGSRIISSGHNAFRNSGMLPQYKRFPHSLHAEQMAIDGVDWNTIKNASILVIRVNNKGVLMMSKPCNYCMDTIKHVGIRWIYYSNRKGEIIKEKV